MIGKRLDKYEIVAKLGEGGMGAVYEARHVGTGRHVAIKVILGELQADEALVARFQREARAAGSIESRHIAQVLDAGVDPETSAPYLVMELLKGEDLDSFLKRMAPLRPDLALRIVAHALAGLERAHAANVVHRDIKPANLYIAETDAGQRVVKLVDFGIAKVKDDLTASKELSLTQTASILGSPMYMSPEQARASKSVDGRADLWSLGVVLYQMLTGRTPHAHAESLTELLLAICSDPAAPAQDLAPWVTPEVAAIAARSVAIDLRARYPSASAMLADIAAIVPDWQRLETSMLVPLDDEERARIAPRGDTRDPGAPTGARSEPALDATYLPPSQRKLPASADPLASSAISSPGTGGLSSTQGAGVPKPRRTLLVAGLGLLGAGVLAVALFRSSPRPDVATASASAPPASAPPAVTGAAATVAVLPSASEARAPASLEAGAPALLASVRPPPSFRPLAAASSPLARPAAVPAATSARPPAHPAVPPPPGTPGLSRDFD